MIDNLIATQYSRGFMNDHVEIVGSKDELGKIANYSVIIRKYFSEATTTAPADTLDNNRQPHVNLSIRTWGMAEVFRRNLDEYTAIKLAKSQAQDTGLIIYKTTVSGSNIVTSAVYTPADWIGTRG